MFVFLKTFLLKFLNLKIFVLFFVCGIILNAQVFFFRCSGCVFFFWCGGFLDECGSVFLWFFRCSGCVFNL